LSKLSRFKQFLGFERKSLSAPDAFLLDLLGAQPSSAGIVITPRVAMTCAPVHAAVQSIAEAMGQLPVHILKSGTEQDTSHPAAALLNIAANDWTPAAKFREDVTRDALLFPHGGFAFINRVGDGKLVELVRIDQELTPVVVTYQNSEPVYTVGAETIDRADLLHIPSPSLSGLGLIHDARDAIGLALIMQRAASKFYKNASRIGGVLSVKDAKGPDATKNAKTLFEAQFRGEGVGGIAALPGDVSFSPVTLSYVESQFLEMSRFSIEEIARFFRVPPIWLYELGRATWSNTEEMGRLFIDFCLMKWITAWEGETQLKLFNPDERATYSAQFITDDFVRANYTAQMEGLP
jgi:HK97 family phage portal protein